MCWPMGSVLTGRIPLELTKSPFNDLNTMSDYAKKTWTDAVLSDLFSHFITK